MNGLFDRLGHNPLLRLTKTTSVDFNDEEGPLLEDVSQYKRIIGRLTIFIPGISYAVNKFNQYMVKPRKPHLNGIHHILQYLKGIPNQRIMFSANPSPHISAYSDADWGSCITTRKSTT